MIRYRAAWILPIERPPIRDGWVTVDEGHVVALGASAPSDGVREVHLGAAAILPGLVNAHTPLELSYLYGSVPPRQRFVAWIRDVMAAQRRRPDPTSAEILAAAGSAIEQSVACGTALVGDISNTLATYDLLAASPLGGVVFYELIRFNAPDPEALVAAALERLDGRPRRADVRVSLAGHAPYSVSPGLFRAIRAALDRDPAAPCSVHVGESLEETEFVRTGTGPWRALLEEVGSWDPGWVAPGVSPVAYLDDNGVFSARTLAVHGVQMTDRDLGRLCAREATLVTCPRSNVHTGAGVPPVARFYASGVRIAIGSDSLASAPDLNIFAEMAALHALAPDVPPAALLDSATWQGARALGFGGTFGTIAPGKRARLLAVDVPRHVDDVEEYLVSGIGSDQIRWVP